MAQSGRPALVCCRGGAAAWQGWLWGGRVGQPGRHLTGARDGTQSCETKTGSSGPCQPHRHACQLPPSTAQRGPAAPCGQPGRLTCTACGCRWTAAPCRCAASACCHLATGGKCRRSRRHRARPKMPCRCWGGGSAGSGQVRVGGWEWRQRCLSCQPLPAQKLLLMMSRAAARCVHGCAEHPPLTLCRLPPPLCA